MKARVVLFLWVVATCIWYIQYPDTGVTVSKTIGSVLYMWALYIAWFVKPKAIYREFEGKPFSNPYLIRYTLNNLGFVSIKLHSIRQSDDQCLHDHPWAFITIILKGGYFEHTFDTSISFDEGVVMPPTKQKWYSPGSILYRPSHYAHRLELKEKVTSGVIEGGGYWEKHDGEQWATTLVFTFMPVREWGFYTKHGWIPWDMYTNGKGMCE